jgi:glycosyltransferase involved in cell wall biosynthesis
MFNSKHILIVVENLPVPFDRRVWQEANTLKENGASVSIICPKMKGYNKAYECINGIEIYRHPLPVEASSAFGYLLEYSISLFWEFVLSWKIFFRKKFQVIQGCNPPDLVFIIALSFKLFGVKYVFDHHDINPELYEAKYNKKKFFYKLLVLLEKLTFKVADYAIATNESFKDIAIGRGKMPENKITVIRSGPRINRFVPGGSTPAYKKNKKILIGYIGVIAEQDGLDLLMQMIQLLTKQNSNVHFAIIGGGTELNKIRSLSSKLGIDEYVDFYGLLSDDKLINDILNTCDICVNPDPPSPYNNLITTNKVMEYMALKKPVIQFDLKEGRFSAGRASLYASDVTDYVNKILWLINNPEACAEMGEFGYNRVKNELCWEHESKKLVSLYKDVLHVQASHSLQQFKTISR